MRTMTRVLALGLLIAATAAPSGAQHRHGKGRNGDVEMERRGGRVIFRESDRGVFQDYFRRYHLAATPLPPGIRKKVLRGRPLPPGIARKAFPPDLIVISPRLARGYDYAMVGPMAVVLDARGLVVDVMVVIP